MGMLVISLVSFEPIYALGGNIYDDMIEYIDWIFNNNINYDIENMENISVRKFFIHDNLQFYSNKDYEKNNR